MTPNLDQERVERAEKAISRMMPTDGGGWIEPHGHDYPNQYLEGEIKLIRAIARTAITAYLGDDGPVDAAAIWKQAEACVPTNWCDDLLTGPSAPRGPLDCPAVEKLLLGIIKRMRARAASPAHPGKEG